MGQRQDHDVPPKALTAHVPPDVKAWVEQEAKRTKQSIGLLVTTMVRAAMAKKSNKEPLS